MTPTIPTIFTADDIAIRARADAESMPVVHLSTRVPDGADSLPALTPRRSHFHLPRLSLEGLTREGSRHTRPSGARHHEPISGSIVFSGYRPVTRYHGTDRSYSLEASFDSRATPALDLPATRGGSRREARVASLIGEANNLMGSAELDVRLARSFTGTRRDEILARARDGFARAERYLHRAEGLARAGHLPTELRAELRGARLRADTSDFVIGA
ncbi:MAG: hypothetical protein K8R69_00180 [Deltaproteobacteria bacterium]|nr:hypothetical protein [Deltaproteobacteria bacterium]